MSPNQISVKGDLDTDLVTSYTSSTMLLQSVRLRIGILLQCALVSVAMGQEFDQVTVPVVTLTDPDLVVSLLDAMLIPVPDTVTALRMIDVTGEGFGPNDLVVVEPSGRTHTLDAFIPITLQRIMREWNVLTDYRHESPVGRGGDMTLQAHRAADAEAAIAGACVSAVDAHYDGDQLDLQLTRGAGTVRVAMWGFDPAGMAYSPPTGDALCRIDPQRYEFAAPLTVTAFAEAGRCVEAWQEDGKVYTRPCADAR